MNGIDRAPLDMVLVAPETGAATTRADARQGRAALIRLAERTNDLIAICDLDGHLEYLNPAGRRLIGLGDADPVPMRLTDYVAPEHRYMIDDLVLPAARRDGIWEGEMRLINVTTGATMDVRRATFSIADDAHGLSGFVSMMRDITVEKAEQLQAKRQAETFYSLIANNPFGIYLVDADFRLRVISRGAERAFENVSPAVGRDFAEVIRHIWPPDFAEDVIARFRATLETGEPYQQPDTRERRADVDLEESYDWRIERVALPDGWLGIVCYFYDLTERERLRQALATREAELTELKEDLERQVRKRTVALHLANEKLIAEAARREQIESAHRQSQKLEALGELTAGIAHDFNNVLGAIIGGFTLIDNRSDDPRLRPIVKMGMSAAERGAAMVRQLMQFARAEEVSPQPVDVAQAVEEAVRMLPRAQHVDLTFSVDCDPAAWPVFVDPVQLQSALLNLASNARDAVQGKGTIRIEVRNCSGTQSGRPAELAERDAVVLSLTDDGHGMDAQTLQRVTQPFFTTKPSGRGTGLGLAMVQRFIASSRGALRIASRPGHGSTFSLYLPRSTAAVVAEVIAPRLEPATLPQTNEVILLVDDDQAMRDILSTGLTERGYEVLGAPSAAAALTLARTRAVDIVVTDIDMPDIDGVELSRRLKAEGLDVPTLFITGGTGGPRDKDEILRKPFLLDDMHRAILRTTASRNRHIAGAERRDRLALRLRSECARSLFEHWREILRGAPFPRFDAFDPSACSEPHRIVMADVDMTKVPIEFRFTLIGDTLRAVLVETGNPADFPMIGSDTVAAREAAYRRCALSGEPSYEFARLDLGQSIVETFERLLLPLSTTGEVVDRIVGAIILDQEDREANHAR